MNFEEKEYRFRQRVVRLRFFVTSMIAALHHRKLMRQNSCFFDDVLFLGRQNSPFGNLGKVLGSVGCRLQSQIRMMMMTAANMKTLYSETPEYFLKPERIITVKEDEIIDNMKHAALLQQCIFGTPEDFVASLGFESFLIYHPKDIVSGDFYWSYRIQHKIIIIIGDCTGHGVSGAMLTVFAQGALNKVITENQNTNPAEILYAVNQELKMTFSRGSNSHGHGMDVSLCSLDTRTLELEFAGSGNPMWVIRDNTILEFTGDILGIGSNMDESHHFHHHKFQLLENDMLYMLTDGYQDQFGGDFPGRPDGKKFMRKRLKQMLLTIAHLPAQDQKKILDITLREWKQGLDQVDDICVFGMSV